jgi:hypothetical protein
MSPLCAGSNFFGVGARLSVTKCDAAIDQQSGSRDDELALAMTRSDIADGPARSGSSSRTGSSLCWTAVHLEIFDRDRLDDPATGDGHSC